VSERLQKGGDIRFPASYSMLICCVQHVRLPGDVAGEMRQFARAVYAALIKAEGTMRICGEEWWGTEFRIHSMQSHAGSALLTRPAQRWQVDTVAPGLEKVKTRWVLMLSALSVQDLGIDRKAIWR
jgi:hypothetical protein